MPTILHLSPFPDTNKCVSGGLIRINEIRAAYREQGFSVIPCHIVTRERDLRNPLDQRLRWFDRIRKKHWGAPRNIGQIRLAWATRHTNFYANRIIAGLAESVDIIQIEHPWLIHLALTIQKSTKLKHPKIIYSAHNIESELHAQLWGELESAKYLIKAILETELLAIQSADLCWGVSDSEVSWFKKHGAKEAIHVPNGCREIQKAGTERLIDQPYALFVGGNFKPNVDGFMEWIGNHISNVAAEGVIAVAGDVGRALNELPALHSAFSTKKIISAGRLELAHLDALINHASALLLPITKGAGSNLKTAEALSSGRPIIATKFSFRGYEKWEGAGGIQFAETPHAFCELINVALQGPIPPQTQHRDCNELLWKTILTNAIRTTALLINK